MLYERFLDSAPHLLERYDARRNVTLIHGDAHVWNVFLPRDGGDDLRLFDWDGWRIGVAAGDLAYMMALHWYPDRRRRLERALLDRYHATLLAHGVNGYDRRALDDDYRWAVLWQMATPVWQAAYDIPPVIWWNHMERIMLAVDDLGCRELLTMNRRYDAVLFDLLTALLDSWSLWNAVAGSEQAGRRWRTAYLAHHLSRPAAISPTRNSSPPPRNRSACRVTSPMNSRRVTARSNPGPKPPSVLGALHAAGVPLGVVTNCSETLGRLAASRIPVPFTRHRHRRTRGLLQTRSAAVSAGSR